MSDLDVGALIGFYVDLVNEYAELTTDVMDFGHRGLKTIDIIEVSATISGVDIEVAVDFRYDNSTDWQSTEWVVLNPNGVVTFPITGLEFRFKVRTSDYSVFKPSYIIIRLKNDDKRFIRGMSNANKATA